MIELTVKTLDSRNHSFSVADDFTVKQLKEHIAETVGISAESQRLIYCGRVLQDEKKLNEYDVNGKVIHLVQRAPPSSNGSGGGGGGASGTSNTTTGQRRPWRNSGNAMYLGAMAFPAEIMDATGIAMQQPRHCLSHSRLTVVRMMLRRAESVLSRLENPSAESSPDNANGAAPPELSVEDDITNGNNPVASVEISTDAFEIRNPDAGEGSSEPLQEEARAPGSTPPESEPQSTNEGGEEANNGRQRRYPRPPMLAELMDRVTDVNIRLAPFMAQYRQLMLDDPALSDQAAVTYNQRLFNSVSEIMHNMSHAYHALSDIMCDFSQPPPRSLRCRPVLIHHSAVVHTGIPIQVSASLGAMPANQAGAGAGANSDTANSNGRPSDNSSPVDTETTAPSAPPPATGTNQPRASPPVAHVAPRIGTVGGGGPGFEFLVDMTPGSITIDSVEAHVVTNSPPNSTDTPPNNWQNPPEFVQNLISALAGQFMGATLQQFQFPSQQNVGTNTQSTQQNTGTNTQTTGSTQTQTTATATQSTGTSTQNASVSTQNTGTSTQNTGISTQNTGTNTQNTGANANSQQPTANGGGGGAASRASGPTGGSQPQPQPQLQPQPQPRANGRPHVHLSPHGLISNHFDPFLPCNSHHIRGSRGRAGRPPNGSNAQAGTAAPPPPPRAMPIPSSISISLRADPVISVEAHPVRSSGTAPGNMQPVLPFPPELQAYLESLRAPVVTNDPAAALPQQIAHLMQAIQGSQGSQNPPTIAQMILNVPGYTYVAGESIVYDICMTLAQSLTMMDVIGLGLGQSACLGRAWPQLRQLITRLNGQTPRLVERLNAELHTHYSIFDNVRLREDVDLPASISRYNQRMLPDIINIIMDESQPATSFHRVLMRKCALYVHQLCALLQYCCVDASGFESLLRACVNRVTSGIPAALQEWTTASSMQNLRSFISSVNTPASEILQYVVFRATSPQPATAPAPAPASQPTSEPMDTHEAEEVRLELAPALNGEVPPVADDAPSAPGWQGALPSEWVPIITRDSQRQRRQNPQGPFSDAYLTGMPSKRRKLISSAKPQGNLSQVISEGMATALGAAGMSSGPEVEAVVQRAGQDSSLRAAYRDQVRSTLSHNLDVNPDFVPDKYPNTTKYFDKK